MTSTASQENTHTDLYKALKNWNDYSAANIQNISVLFSAITPLQDIAQITQQVIDLAQPTSWQSASKKTLDFKALSDSYKEWMEIQSASFSTLCDDNQQLFKTTVESATLLANTTTKASSPECALASYINTNIDILKQYQSDITNQMQHLNSIQSAYKAWFQQTFIS